MSTEIYSYLLKKHLSYAALQNRKAVSAYL